MIAILIYFALIACLAVHGCITAPIGYEDDTGFHIVNTEE